MWNNMQGTETAGLLTGFARTYCCCDIYMPLDVYISVNIITNQSLLLPVEVSLKGAKLPGLFEGLRKEVSYSQETWLLVGGCNRIKMYPLGQIAKIHLHFYKF